MFDFEKEYLAKKQEQQQVAIKMGVYKERCTEKSQAVIESFNNLIEVVNGSEDEELQKGVSAIMLKSIDESRLEDLNYLKDLKESIYHLNEYLNAEGMKALA